MGKLLIMESPSRSFLASILVTLLFGVTVLLFLIDGSQFEYVTIAKFTQYAVVLSLIIINWPFSKNVRWATLLAVLIVLYEASMLFFGFDVSINALKIITLVLSLVAFSTCRIRPRYQAVITAVSAGLLAYLVFMSVGYYDGFFQAGFYGTQDALNPNSLAVAVFAFYLLVDKRIDVRKYRFLLWLVAFFATFNYGSRAVMLALVIYGVLTSFVKIKSMGLRRFILVSFAVASIFFPLLYVQAYKDGQYADVEINNKSIFGGRQLAWEEVFDTSSASTLVSGMDGTGLVKTFPSESLLNMYMSIYYTAGLVVLCLTMLVFVRLGSSRWNADNRLFSILIALMMYGWFESALYDGDYLGILILVAFVGYSQSAEVKGALSEDNK